jgi:DNA-directed RNA polymerase subunit M/transcription elongation factor TFIIS
MHFCTECGNMYYIRLTETNSIVYYCRNCGHEDDTITIDTDSTDLDEPALGNVSFLR